MRCPPVLLAAAAMLIVACGKDPVKPPPSNGASTSPSPSLSAYASAPVSPSSSVPASASASAAMPQEPPEIPQCGEVLRASAITWRKDGQAASILASLHLRAAPLDGGPFGTVTLACDGCAGAQPVNVGPQQGGPPAKHAVVRALFDLARLDPLPTHATIRWATQGADVSSCEVPLSLMVENAPAPTSRGPLRPFVRPRAPVPAPASVHVTLSGAEGALTMLGPTLRVRATVENRGAAPVQVDRAALVASIGPATWKPVDNDTPRPLLSWAPGMFFCVRDLVEDAFPDHTILRPREHVDGILCWTGAEAIPKGGEAIIAYGAPAVFREVVKPSSGFMGVFLPPEADH